MKTRTELESMTKSEIDEYGNTLGIDLDARHTKATMIDELIAFVEDAGDLTDETTAEVDEVVDDITVEQTEEEIVELHTEVKPPRPPVDVRKPRRKRYCAL